MFEAHRVSYIPYQFVHFELKKVVSGTQSICGYLTSHRFQNNPRHVPYLVVHPEPRDITFKVAMVPVGPVWVALVGHR